MRPPCLASQMDRLEGFLSKRQRSDNWLGRPGPFGLRARLHWTFHVIASASLLDFPCLYSTLLGFACLFAEVCEEGYHLVFVCCWRFRSSCVSWSKQSWPSDCLANWRDFCQIVWRHSFLAQFAGYAIWHARREAQRRPKRHCFHCALWTANLSALSMNFIVSTYLSSQYSMISPYCMPICLVFNIPLTNMNYILDHTSLPTPNCCNYLPAFSLCSLIFFFSTTYQQNFTTILPSTWGVIGSIWKTNWMGCWIQILCLWVYKVGAATPGYCQPKKHEEGGTSQKENPPTPEPS